MRESDALAEMARRIRGVIDREMMCVTYYGGLSKYGLEFSKLFNN